MTIIITIICCHRHIIPFLLLLYVIIFIDIMGWMQAVLQPEELALLLASKHKPNYVLQILSELVESSCIVSPERFRMDQNITFFMDAQGACERILKTPIPLSYTRWAAVICVCVCVCVYVYRRFAACCLAGSSAVGGHDLKVSTGQDCSLVNSSLVNRPGLQPEPPLHKVCIIT